MVVAIVLRKKRFNIIRLKYDNNLSPDKVGCLQEDFLSVCSGNVIIFGNGYTTISQRSIMTVY